MYHQHRAGSYSPAGSPGRYESSHAHRDHPGLRGAPYVMAYDVVPVTSTPPRPPVRKFADSENDATAEVKLLPGQRIAELEIAYMGEETYELEAHGSSVALSWLPRLAVLEEKVLGEVRGGENLPCRLSVLEECTALVMKLVPMEIDVLQRRYDPQNPPTGSLLPRIDELERSLMGSEQEGDMASRIDNLEQAKRKWDEDEQLRAELEALRKAHEQEVAQKVARLEVAMMGAEQGGDDNLCRLVALEKLPYGHEESGDVDERIHRLEELMGL